MKSFSAKILKIGINPYVFVPEDILNSIFEQAGKNKGAIPIRGTVNGKPFMQTLVKYQGAWRLHINRIMREAAGVDVGDQVHIRLEFDPGPRVEPVPPKLRDALDKNKSARTASKCLLRLARKKSYAISIP